MPLRLDCVRKRLSPGLLIQSYWPGGLFPLANVVAYLVCGQAVTCIDAGIDTRSDFVAFGSLVAQQLGLTLPCQRQATFSGAAGTLAGTLSFPPDGQVGLFVTDHKEYCYLPSQPIGFHPPSPNTHLQRSVLGMTGFLQHFDFFLQMTVPKPFFELHPGPNFPGQTGVLPRPGSIVDFVRQLHSP